MRTITITMAVLSTAVAMTVPGPNPVLGLASRGMGLIAPIFKVENQLQAQVGSALMAESREEVAAEISSETASGCTIYTYGLSPFSTEAIALLDRTGCKYTRIELGAEWFLLGPKTSAKRGELLEMTGQSSLPHVFIGGEHVGGLTSIASLNESGELQAKLKKARCL